MRRRRRAIDGERPAEVFLRWSADTGAAAFTEKWSAYREALLVTFDACLGAARQVERRKDVDIEGRARLTVPQDWLVRPEAGCVAITDAADEALLEVSQQPFPLDPRLPSLPARLDAALATLGDAARGEAAAAAIHHDRGDVELAWTDYPYESTDSKTGAARPARLRILLAGNDALQVLMTFAYWPEDASWALAEWERIVSTLRLSRG